MKLNKSSIKRILVITLSNIGDIVLTTPVVDILKKEFPNSRIDVMVGPKGKEIFQGDPRIFKLIIYDKTSAIPQKRRLVAKLRKIKYDFVVDLRNTLFPILLGSKVYTSPIHKAPERFQHRKDVHLWKLENLGIDTSNAEFYLYTSPEDESYIDNFLKKTGIGENLVVVSPGSKSYIKRWTKEGFASVSDMLIKELKVDVVMVGDSSDNAFIQEIAKLTKNKVINFSGRTTLRQLISLIKRASLLITNDSAPLHIASATNVNTIVFFGPTNPNKYGPLAEKSFVIRKELICSPCESAQCRYNHECMRLITPEEVFEVAKKILQG